MYIKNNNKKVLDLFFIFPRRQFHLREIARLVKLNPNTVSKILNDLVNEELIKKETSAVTVNFWANLDNERFIFEKRISNIKNIYYSGLIDELVKKYNNPDAIILYGSYSRGEDIEDSDIDIAMISKRKADISLEKYEKKLERGIHLLEVDLQKIKKELLNNLINGFIIHGYLLI